MVLLCCAFFGFLEPGLTTIRPVVGVFIVDRKPSVRDSAPVSTGEIPEIASSCSVVITGIWPGMIMSGAVFAD